MYNIDMEFVKGIFIIRLSGIFNKNACNQLEQDLDQLIIRNGIKYLLINLESIKKIYSKSIEIIFDNYIKLLKRNVMYRIMPLMMQQIVFTKKEIENLSGVSRNAVSTAIDKLVQMNILVEDSTYAKLAYRYKSIYNVFLGKDSV